MSSNRHLNYAILGYREFEVFPIDVYKEKMLVEDILGYFRGRTKSNAEFWLVCDNSPFDSGLDQRADRLFTGFQLKEPIPFSEVESNPWLLDPSTNLRDYATRHFLAERLSDIWTNRDHKFVHAIARLVPACTSLISPYLVL